jgi:hypothetical protein
LQAELSLQELALESAELLPDRDTMQLIVIGSFALNAASITQTATSGAVANIGVDGSGDVTVVSYAANYAQVTQNATSGDVTDIDVGG